jgi:hypothetical protein
MAELPLRFALGASEGMAELPLRFALAETRIPIRVEDTGFGRQNRPLSVDVDGPALEPEGGPIEGVPESGAHALCELGVLLVALELPSPAIELPGGRGVAAVVGHEKGRPRIPRPRVVDLEREGANGRPAEPSGRGNRFGRRDHRHGLELGDRPRNAGVRFLCLGQGLTPEVLAMGPRHPAARMGLPLGGHAESRFEGCLGPEVSRRAHRGDNPGAAPPYDQLTKYHPSPTLNTILGGPMSPNRVSARQSRRPHVRSVDGEARDIQHQRGLG